MCNSCNDDYKETQPYKDKNNISIQEEDFILLENEKICQALRCDDGTLLYEELVWNYNKGKLELADEPNYPDSYNNDEVEIISYNKAVGLLRRING